MYKQIADQQIGVEEGAEFCTASQKVEDGYTEMHGAGSEILRGGNLGSSAHIREPLHLSDDGLQVVPGVAFFHAEGRMDDDVTKSAC